MTDSLSDRLHAWFLSRDNPRYESIVAPRKNALLRDLEGTILELGPGGGQNFRFFHPAIHWIGLEPNPAAHRFLRERAARAGISAEVRIGRAEEIPAPSASLDAVISTLVLCTVADPKRALSEVMRVLKPGGIFSFIEHVAAPPDTGMRSVQKFVTPVWKAISGGCHPARETGRSIAAAGFEDLRMEEFKISMPVVAPHIAGSGRKPE